MENQINRSNMKIMSYNNRGLFSCFTFLVRVIGFLGGLLMALFLCSCGQNEDQHFEIQGQERVCSVIETKACGLTLACENDGFYECVSN